MKKQASANELYGRLVRAIQGAMVDEVPAGFKTVKQWAAEWSRSIPQTAKVLRDATVNGLAEKQKLRATHEDGRVMPVWHYKVKA